MQLEHERRTNRSYGTFLVSNRQFSRMPRMRRGAGSKVHGSTSLGRRVWRTILVVATISSFVLGTTGLSSAGQSVSHNGGTATYALGVGYSFNMLGPFVTVANCEVYQFDASAGSWESLYYAGVNGGTGIDYGLSLASPPHYSAGDTAVTVTLRHDYHWSTGLPVTTKDVRFFFQILADQPLCITFDGLLPKDVTSITYTNTYSFTLHLNHSYNPLWFTENQLQWINPLPAQAWDRNCMTCPVGNDATTAAGAKAVTSFLMDQFRTTSTYSTNPLWKVVDGPWMISSYAPVTHKATFVRNPHYTGPTKPHLSAYSIVSFTTGTAETDALRAGTVDMGFLTASEYGEIPYFKSHGYSVLGWPQFANNAVEYGFTNPTYGPLVKQLYLRQALQHLVTENLYISKALHGYGQPDYGNVSVLSHTNVVSPLLRRPLYPYSVTSAKKLLSSHGWKLGKDGIDYCARPGSGANECGAGISSGRKLSLLVVYATGSTSTLAEVSAFSAAAAKAGVHFQLRGESETTEETEGECPPGPCDYGLLVEAGELWTYGYNDGVPEASQEFGTGAFYGGGYTSPEANRLFERVKESTSSSFTALYKMEDYLAKNCAGLWLPVTEPITIVSPKLKGWSPLLPNTVYQPTRWYLTG